jgi:outer membrane protein
MKRFLIIFLILLSTNTWSQNYEINKGDWILRSGYTFLVPQFNNDSQVGMAVHSMPTFSFSYLMTDNLGVEFLTGIPSTIDIYNKALGEEAKIASFISLSPNATVQYYFKPKDSDFRPYIGLGLIYSSFHKEKSLGILSGANFKLKKSLDPIYQVGFDYVVNEKTSLNLDVRKLKTSSGATATELHKTIMGPYAPERIDYEMGMQPLTVSLNFTWLFHNPKKLKERRALQERVTLKQKREIIRATRNI